MSLTPERKVLIATICTACAGLEILTKNSTLFGHVVATVTCATCAILAGHTSYEAGKDGYDKYKALGKDGADAVNKAAKKTREELQKKLL
jgi:hypothetical protein